MSKQIKYIALLRGINVGGKNIIKMSDLKKAFVNVGILDVSTYIQSGNVLFISDLEEKELKYLLEDSIYNLFGMNIPVILRSVSELEEMKADIPFSDKDISEIERNSKSEVLYFFMFADFPSSFDVERIIHHQDEGYKYYLKGRNMYVLFNNTILNSKFAGALQKTDRSVTFRNIKTINKLIELGNNL